MATAVNHGLVKRGPSNAVVCEIPMPRLRDDYILVRTAAVALNPADWQDLDEKPSPPQNNLLLGCDCAGWVEAVGKNVKKHFKKGDRIAGMAHGVNDIEPEDGAFAEYVMIKGDIAMHVPSNLDFEAAASLPCGVGTVALGFYRYLRIPFPPTPQVLDAESFLLIYGGSSATGSLAIQFAKLSGLKIVTTCSPRNFDLVKSLGADAAFDYREPDCAKDIRKFTGNKLTQVFDTIATPQTAQLCADALSSTSGHRHKYVNLMGVKCPREDVESIFFLGYSMTGESYWFEGEEWPASPEDFELAARVFAWTEELLAQEKLRNHPLSVHHGGLAAIPGGLQEMKDGHLSGQKLVYLVGSYASQKALG